MGYLVLFSSLGVNFTRANMVSQLILGSQKTMYVFSFSAWVFPFSFLLIVFFSLFHFFSFLLVLFFYLVLSFALVFSFSFFSPFLTTIKRKEDPTKSIERRGNNNERNNKISTSPKSFFLLGHLRFPSFLYFMTIIHK